MSIYDWADCPYEIKLHILDDIKQASQISRALINNTPVVVWVMSKNTGFGLARIKPEGTLVVYYLGQYVRSP